MIICIDANPVILIKIISDPEVEEKYTLEFRNSFGFMEKMLISGSMKYEPEITEGDEYVENTNFVFRKKRSRNEVIPSYKSNIGFKRIVDILFVQDLLLSEEVYLKNLITGEKMECKVSSTISTSLMQQQPEGVPITIMALNSDKYMSLEFNYNVFDYTFDNSFN